MNADLVVVAGIVIGIAVIAAVVVFLVARGRRAPRKETEPSRLASRGQFVSALRNVWGTGPGPTTWDQLEEMLLAADVGVGPAQRILTMVRSSSPGTLEEARGALRAALLDQFSQQDRTIQLGAAPSVILIVGVNGSGKTTTIAKLAHRLKRQRRTVVLGAADTFRAAAGEQLDVWAGRVGVTAVMGQQGGDPASVAFDTISSARARNADVAIIDTAGRLQAKKNLMAELEKIHRVASNEAEVTEVLIVLDATSGQNALSQVEQFSEAVPLTGIVLAKLDGTAKGGIVITVEDTLGIPVKLVGVGEGLGDLEAFRPDSFVDSLLEDR